MCNIYACSTTKESGNGGRKEQGAHELHAAADKNATKLQQHILVFSFFLAPPWGGGSADKAYGADGVDKPAGGAGVSDSAAETMAAYGTTSGGLEWSFRRENF